MNRIKLMVGTFFVLTAMSLSWGIGLTYADQAPPPAAPGNQAVTPKAAADAKARAVRAAQIKQRADARKRLMEVIGAKQSQGTPAPGNAGQGGAK
jgi:hypothetical protein